MMKKKFMRSGQKGFTLSETLFAMLILLMVTSIVATGIPIAGRALKNAVDASHGQVLLSTTMTALRDELGTATGIEKDPNKKKVIYIDASGVSSSLKVIESVADIGSEAEGDQEKYRNAFEQFGGAGIYIMKLVKPKDSNTGFKSVVTRLVSEEAATDGLYETFDISKFTVQSGVISIGGLGVCRGQGSNKVKLADLGTDGTYKIEVIAMKGAGQ